MLRLHAAQTRVGMRAGAERILTPSSRQSKPRPVHTFRVRPALKSKVESVISQMPEAWETLSARLCHSTIHKVEHLPPLCQRLNHVPAGCARPVVVKLLPVLCRRQAKGSTFLSGYETQHRLLSSQPSQDGGQRKQGWTHSTILRTGSWVVVALVVVVVAGVAYAVVSNGHSYNNLSWCQNERAAGSNTFKPSGTTLSLQEAVAQATDLCQKIKDESGSPGLVAAVSVDGQLVWTQGLGYADVENRLPCKPESVMRIASISKAITMAAVAKAMENGELDIDKPVQYYVPQFPEKTVDGEKVTLTTRQLVSHLAGIRSYDKDYMTPPKRDAPPAPTTSAARKRKTDKRITVAGEFTMDEYYIKDKLDTMDSALDLFKDDPLVHKPGSKFLYTTHGWTLVAAVLEGATKRKFPDLIRTLFCDLGLESTYLDENEPIIYNRSRFYVRNKSGRLENAPYVDCAYKYAGGGILSTVTDLVNFGNAMLYSLQCCNPGSGVAPQQPGKAAIASNDTGSQVASNPQESSNRVTTSPTERPDTDHHGNLPGYLKPSTMRLIWKPVAKERVRNNMEFMYTMGWEMLPEKRTVGFGCRQPFCVLHTGGAVGASGILLIVPASQEGEGGGKGENCVARPPRGVTVAIFVNMIQVSLSKTAVDVARLFQRVSFD